MKTYATALTSGRLTQTGRKRTMRRASKAEEQIQEQIRMSFVTEEEFAEWILGGRARQWGSCTACVLSDCRVNVCYGEGPSAPIMVVIGEAPGRNDDLSGRVAQGPEWVLFRKVCEHAGIDLAKHVYLTNMVACRPYVGPRSDDRKPRAGEVDTCGARLREQLAVLKPTVILLMGRTALRLLEGVGSGERLGDWRGRVPRANWPALGGVVKVNLKLVYVTYAPSFPMRQQTKQKKRMKLQLIIDDLTKVKKVIDLVARRRNDRED